MVVTSPEISRGSSILKEAGTEHFQNHGMWRTARRGVIIQAQKGSIAYMSRHGDLVSVVHISSVNDAKGEESGGSA